jgi:hypothetical protein
MTSRNPAAVPGKLSAMEEESVVINYYGIPGARAGLQPSVRTNLSAL